MDLLLNKMLENNITIFFIFVIVVIFCWGVHPKGRTIVTSSTLTSVGILGTFVGISLALLELDFSPHKINDSIPKVIESMETAFISSLVGILCAIVYGIVCKVHNMNQGVSEGATLDTLNETLQGIHQGTQDLKNAISGDGDSSLSTQMVKLRDENKDGFKNLDTSFTKFADKVSEMVTKGIIESLEKVIQDFNNNLTEQFGDNFKQLNQAVHALLEWQQQYREHVEQLTEKFETVQRGVETNTESLTAIAKESEKIPPTVDSLAHLIKQADDTITELDDRLSAFAHMKQQAQDAFPIIQENLETMTEGLKTNIHTMSETLASTVENASQGFTNATTQLTQTSEQFNQGIQDKAQAVYDTITETAQGIVTSMRDNQNSITQHADTTLQTITNSTDSLIKQSEKIIQDTESQIVDSLNRCIEGLEKTTTESLGQLDQNMQETVQRQVDTMGNRLTAVVDKFVESYEIAQNTKQSKKAKRG